MIISMTVYSRSIIKQALLAGLFSYLRLVATPMADRGASRDRKCDIFSMDEACLPGAE